jgi:type VII secretion protein EccB
VQSRRDLVQAQAYLNGRLVSALLTADPDAAETPTRRTTMGMLIGIALLVLGVGGTAGFALIFGGHSDQWRTPGALIVDKDTGNRYVFAEGNLHPVLNFASARLLLGSSMKIVRVAHDSLEGVPHGQSVGIPGAPDVLPEPGRRTHLWQVCATAPAGAAGRDRPAVALELGTEPSSGARELGDDEAVWVTGPDDARYLLWRGRRLRIAQPALATALGYTRGSAPQVGAGLLNAVPAGPDLTAIDVPGRGKPGALLDGRPTRVGQVFVVRTPGAGDRYFLQMPGSLAVLSAVDLELVLADSAIREAYPDGAEVRALPMSAAAAASVTQSELPGRAGLPTTLPRLIEEPGFNPCVLLDAGTADFTVRIEVDTSVRGRPPVVEPGVTAGPLVADRIAVTPAGGVLARPLVAPGVVGASLYLINDLGVKYPVTAESAEALGFSAKVAVSVPPGVLDLLPTGPALASTG